MKKRHVRTPDHGALEGDINVTPSINLCVKVKRLALEHSQNHTAQSWFHFRCREVLAARLRNKSVWTFGRFYVYFFMCQAFKAWLVKTSRPVSVSSLSGSCACKNAGILRNFHEIPIKRRKDGTLALCSDFDLDLAGGVGNPTTT